MSDTAFQMNKHYFYFNLIIKKHRICDDTKKQGTLFFCLQDVHEARSIYLTFRTIKSDVASQD